MDRIENNESIVGMEGAIQEQLNKFQNWSKTQAFVNPTNGKISIGMLNEDGGLSKNASEFSSIEGITNRMRSRYDRYDYSPDLQSWIDGVGKDVRVVRKKGVLTLSDASQDAGFQTALDEQVGALVDSNPIRVVSILEELGLIDGYDIDGEKTTQKGDKFNVAMKNQNDSIVMPEVTDDMKAKAREFLSGQMLNMLDKEQTSMPEDRAAQSFYRLLGEGQKQDEDVLNAVGILYSGTPDEIDGALKSLVAINPNIQSAKRSDVGVDLILKDGDETKTVNLPFSDGQNIMNGRDWTIGAAGLITGKGKSYDRIARDASWNPLRPDFTSNVEKSFSYGTPRKDPLATYKQLSGQITEDIFKLAEETAAPKLAPILSQLGFSIDEAIPGMNKITVTAPDGTSKNFDVYENAAEAGPQAEALKAFIRSKLDLQSMAEIGLTAGGNSGGTVR